MNTILQVFAVTVIFDATIVRSLPPAQKIRKCGPNEILSECYSDCQLTCKNRIKGYKDYCTEDCSRTQCVCLPAHYRHDNGTCVLKEDCSPPQCGVNEVYNPCGTSHLETCEERGNTCETRPLHCVEGCFCTEGSFLARNGSCIPEHKCPPRTCDGPNEYFDDCPKVCSDDQLCTNARNNITCPGTMDCCEPQCRCKDGYYRDLDGICITADACWSDDEEYAPEKEQQLERR